MKKNQIVPSLVIVAMWPIFKGSMIVNFNATIGLTRKLLPHNVTTES